MILHIFIAILIYSCVLDGNIITFTTTRRDGLFKIYMTVHDVNTKEYPHVYECWYSLGYVAASPL